MADLYSSSLVIGQVFHVSPGGEVTTPSYPETLHLIRLDRTVDKAGTELPPAFIEVGDWTYPLVRGKSPIMKSSYGETITIIGIFVTIPNIRRLHVS